MNELIKRLMKELGITKQQASGGLVALMRAAEKHLSREDFAAFVADVPGAAKLLKDAPPPSASTPASASDRRAFIGPSGAMRRLRSHASRGPQLPYIDSAILYAESSRRWSDSRIAIASPPSTAARSAAMSALTASSSSGVAMSPNSVTARSLV